MNRCPSTFLGNQCGKWETHNGCHDTIDRTGHVTVWGDPAADETQTHEISMHSLKKIGPGRYTALSDQFPDRQFLLITTDEEPTT